MSHEINPHNLHRLARRVQYKREDSDRFRQLTLSDGRKANDLRLSDLRLECRRLDLPYSDGMPKNSLLELISAHIGAGA
jgi:hypothetical protein